MMNKSIVFAFVFVLFFLVGGLASFGQNTTEATQENTTFALIKTTDGNRYYGEVLDSTNQFILLKTESLGSISIQQTDIKAFKKFDATHHRKKTAYASNKIPRRLQVSHYFLLPSGYGLQKNKGHFQNASIFVNRANYGINNKLSVGAGFIPLVFIAKSPTPVYIGVKGSIPIIRNKINLAVGGMGVKIVGAEAAIIGYTYGLGTFGSIDRNVSAGIAYSFVSNSEDSASAGPLTIGDEPLLLLSGTFRYSKNSYIVTENYIPTPALSGKFRGFFSLGGRTIWEKSSFSYGLFVPIPVDNLGITLILPWIGITIPF